jgi:trimeric autotransporter adhesin
MKYDVTLPNVTMSMDDSTLDVFSGASLGLNGSSNTVIVEDGARSVSVSGANNTVSASGAASIAVSGSNNTVNAGAGSSVDDYNGHGDKITVGANSSVRNADSATIYATQGGANISANKSTIYASGATISEVSTDGLDTVIGDNNQIALIAAYNGWRGHADLNLNGKNNTITFDSGDHLVTTSSGSFSATSAGMVMAGSVIPTGMTLTSGALAVQLGDGNVAKLNGIASGSQVTYKEDTGALTWNLYDTGVTPVGSTVYNVSGSVNVAMDNSVFSVLNGASLSLSGSSDVVYGTNGAISLSGTSSKVNGNGNQITLGQGGNTLDLTGSNNTITFDARAGAQTIKASTGETIVEDATGAIYYYGSFSFSIRNGVVTLGFGDGNKVVVNNVRSSSGPELLADNSTNQLVSAMASYSNEPAAVSSTFTSDAGAGSSSLFASSHQ